VRIEARFRGNAGLLDAVCTISLPIVIQAPSLDSRRYMLADANSEPGISNRQLIN
jgi:hypothetical protein